MRIKLKYISSKDPLYSNAVGIRINCFFKGMLDAEHLINDTYEDLCLHLVCVNNDGIVLGTARLYIDGSKAIISQMAVDKNSQNNGIGKLLLLELVGKSKLLKAIKMELSARETAIAFYNRFDFAVRGEKYASKKTGIIHHQMMKVL